MIRRTNQLHQVHIKPARVKESAVSLECEVGNTCSIVMLCALL
jgi:hypothetical protein